MNFSLFQRTLKRIFHTSSALAESIVLSSLCSFYGKIFFSVTPDLKPFLAIKTQINDIRHMVTTNSFTASLRMINFLYYLMYHPII